MNEEVIDSSSEAGKDERPVFLTVLCILTFIGSGYGILSSLTGFFTTSFLVLPHFLNLVASVLCLYGAIQIWGLNKSGFIDYVAGAALSVLASVVALANPYMFSIAIITIVINIAFVLMYKANLAACSINKPTIISKLYATAISSTNAAANVDDSNQVFSKSSTKPFTNINNSSEIFNGINNFDFITKIFEKIQNTRFINILLFLNELSYLLIRISTVISLFYIPFDFNSRTFFYKNMWIFYILLFIVAVPIVFFMAYLNYRFVKMNLNSVKRNCELTN